MASSDADDIDMIARNPAVKLLDFFNGLWMTDTDTKGLSTQPMAVERAFTASPAMRELEPVKLEWMRKWVEEWIAYQNAQIREDVN